MTLADAAACSTAFDTRCVHVGSGDDPGGAPYLPIYNVSTFGFRSTSDMLDVVSGKCCGNLYTRYGYNPTILALESQLASIENAEDALAFCSGMAAIAATCFTYGRDGIACIGDLYGGTWELMRDQLPTLGMQTWLLQREEADARLPELLADGVRMVFLETPSNPTLELHDIARIAQVAHEYGALLVIDNTFASPVNQHPLALGADISLHSATKYLGGHSDLTAGAIMGSADVIRPVWNWRKNLGQSIAPETAALLARSIRSLPVRVRQQSSTALEVARALEQHPRVRCVHYPGLESHPHHELAKQQMPNGFGGVLSFEVDGSAQDAAAVVDALQLFTLAASLGGVESLVVQPIMCTHYCMTMDERLRAGIADSLLRLSIGLESSEDLIADLRQALDR